MAGHHNSHNSELEMNLNDSISALSTDRYGYCNFVIKLCKRIFLCKNQTRFNKDTVIML